MNPKNRALFSLTILALLIAPFTVGYSAASTGWQTVISETGDNCAYSIASSADGAYVVVGNTYSSSLNGSVSWLIKLDSSGNTLWSRTFDAFGNAELFAVSPTSDSGYILAGYACKTGSAQSDAWLLKTDSNGNLIWNRTYGGNGDDKAFAVTQTSDGGYVFSGYTGSYGQGGDDFWLCKIDVNGNLLWNQTYGGQGHDQAYCVVQSSDGGFAFAGQTTSANGANDALIFKTSTVGQIEWNRTYGGTGNDGVYALIQTLDGGYALAGYTYLSSSNKYDSWLVKTDVSGNLLWQKTIGSTGDSQALSVIQNSDQSFVVVGYTNSYGADGSQILLVKIDSKGVSQTTQVLGGKGDDAAFDVVPSGDGGFAVAGHVDSRTNNGTDVWVAKVYADEVKSSPISTIGQFPLVQTIIILIIAVAAVLILFKLKKR